jgi:hypothetical protein
VKSQKMVLAKASGGMVCGEGGLCSGHGKCNTETAKCDCMKPFFGDVAKGSTVLASTNSGRIAMDMDCVKWATASALQAGAWHLFA